MNIKDESFLILVIVLRLPKRANSYDLFKIMGWKFDLLNPTHILSELVNNKMLLRDETSANFIYEITNLGKEAVYKNLEKNRLSIYEKFNKEKDFLDALFTKL